MKTGFFPKLAWTGIKKNRKLYVPYILSCIGMITMFYIIQSISYSDLLTQMRGGGNLETILGLGKFVIAAFALIFLFYTNSFLIRRRYREFGLYNILGMDKRSISRIIVWESLIIAVISIAAGLVLGFALSKLAELGLANVVHADINYSFTISGKAFAYTAEMFAAIFVLLLVKSLFQVRRSRPLELLSSEKAGEKPPRANWIFAVIGLLILGGAYYISVSIKSPLSAITLFFVAVIMVIVATYILFMAGSVALCKLLQKNKSYYYKKNHFVSVSSMVYRMKRNGAGLASICILSTMVLVMLTSTSSLYFGANDSIEARFPTDNEIALDVEGLDNLSDEKLSTVREAYEKVFAEHNAVPENVSEYRYCAITGLMTSDSVDAADVLDIGLGYEDFRQLYFVSQDDYNKAMGTDISLGENEAMLYTMHGTYDRDTLEMNGMKLNIVGTLDDFISISDANTIIMPSLLFVVHDYEVLRPLESMIDNTGDSMLSTYWNYGYDLSTSDEEAIAIYREQTDCLSDIEFLMADNNGYGFSGGCKADEIADFFTTYGGLFFIGIILSIVFIFAAVMIIYYKQVSEGYEDQSRFEIMQKVGMTKADIKKSINSQVLTVFFAPLVFAGMHLAFAFPLVWKLLQLFNLRNLSLVIWVNIGAFVVFGIFYAIVYKLTAGAYYSIVSGSDSKS